MEQGVVELIILRLACTAFRMSSLSIKLFHDQMINNLKGVYISRESKRLNGRAYFAGEWGGGRGCY